MNSRKVMALMALRGVTARDISKVLGVCYQTALSKLHGKKEWNIRELNLLRDYFELDDSKFVEVFFE